MVLQETFNELTPKEKKFFTRLQHYLHTQVYFYGSVQRYDYFRGKSDIDIDIFSSNVESTLARLAQFLNMSNNNFRQTFTSTSTRNIVGYKVFYSSKNASMGLHSPSKIVAEDKEREEEDFVEGRGGKEGEKEDDASTETFNIEISVFDEKDKAEVLKQHQKKISIPCHAIVALVLLKLLFYEFSCVPKDVYKNMKREILSTWIGITDTPFVVMKISNRHIH